MEGYVTIKSFYHNRLHLAGEKVLDSEINPIWHDQLEKQGCIRFVSRPDIIISKKPKPVITKKPKKNVRKGKK